MLSTKDLEKIREIIKEEIRIGNTIKDVVVERTDLSTGKTEVKTVDLYVPEWIAEELPSLAGALRGVQETADHAKNNSWKLMLSLDSAMTKFREQLLADIKQISHDDAEVLKIESIS
jgi:hypothetical protein